MPELTSRDPILALAEPPVRADPYPAYARMRETTPVFFYERLDSWMFTRYADCVEVLRDTTRFAADWRRVGERVPPRAINMLTLDPPEHTVVRRLFIEVLRAQDQAALTATIAGHTAELLDRLARRPSFDVLTELAEPLALSTTAAYLGVPAPDVAWTSRIGRAVGAAMDAGLWPDRAGPVREAQEELAVLVDGWLADPPDTGILGTLARRTAGCGVDPSVLANTVRGLLFSGYSSGSKLLAQILVALLHERSFGLADWRAAEPGRAVEELVRYCSPIHAVARACLTDTTVGGTRVRAGQAVTLLLVAANRDPDRFAAPETVRLDRYPNPHLGLGRGPKSCLGNPYSTALVRAFLDRLADRYPGVRALDEPTWQQNLTLRSIDRFTTALA
ncbi:cytochrome P450 [Actinocatenispora rupis]|uniref:Cytochrome P450 n=1 Tax=Actinocatenispora rupis TaxID=519421 RepID=A0A8J3ND40_9ACTN|nr:cytochrome P450 [Actinocatenispora rupis]GID12472.1 cytochrome P450 [Actinocatenispora rupis]